MTAGALEYDGQGMFIVRDGIRIAKRPAKVTRRAWTTWIPLVAGFTVRTNDRTGEVDLTYDPPIAH
jgi:hypothetical protein